MSGFTNPMATGVLHRMGTSMVQAGFQNPTIWGILHLLGAKLVGVRPWWYYYLLDDAKAMFKNVAGQKIILMAIDTATGKPKTGDALNITAYVKVDNGLVAALGDITATEVDAANAKGAYEWDLTQAETNGDRLHFSGKSATGDVEIIPRLMWTLPPNFPTLTIANGAADADLERILGVVVNPLAAQLGANVVQVSGDPIAADNLEAACDGTGFNVGAGQVVAASVTGAVGSVAGNVSGNVVGTIGGLTAAALADFFDTNTLTTYGAAVAGSVVKEIVANTLTAVAAGAAVWDALRINHVLVGSFGQGVASVQGNVTGSVASVAGNVAGNVVGSVGSIATGGIAAASFAAGAINDAAIAADAIGSSELAASAITEIVNGVWNELQSLHTTVGTFGKFLDIEVSSRSTLTPAQVNTEADLALADVGLTIARTGYLDNLNIGGLVASSAQAVALQNNTRTVRVVPSQIERPDAGTLVYKIHLYIYDSVGNMEAPDSAPTINLTNASGTQLNTRLGSALDTTLAVMTVVGVEVGHYEATYTATTSHAMEHLIFEFTVVEGGVTRKYGDSSLVVDWTAATLDSPGVTTLLTRITTSDVSVAATRFLTMVQLDGAVWQYTVNALENTPIQGTGTGARTVNITVTDAVNPISDANVRLTKGIETFVAATNVSGQLTFNVDDGVWTVAITKPGYSFTQTTLLVDGNKNVTYIMTLVMLPTSAPGLTTVFAVVYDEKGIPEPNIPITCIAIGPVDVDNPPDGWALDNTARVEISDAIGLVQFPNTFKDIKYSFRRGNLEREYFIDIPASAGPVFELPIVIGKP